MGGGCRETSKPLMRHSSGTGSVINEDTGSVTRHIKDPVPFIEKSRASCPGGRCTPSLIHQVIITGLNKLYDSLYDLALKIALDSDRA